MTWNQTPIKSTTFSSSSSSSINSNQNNQKSTPQTPSRSTPLRPEHLLFNQLYPTTDSLLINSINYQNNNYLNGEFVLEGRVSESKGVSVYLATHKSDNPSNLSYQNNQNVIIKMIRLSGAQADRKCKLREVEILSRLQPHKNIVQLISAWEQSLSLHLELVYYPHGSLYDFYSSFDTFDTTFNLNWLALFHGFVSDILNALEYVHGLGIVHLDVKPSNIFVCQNSRNNGKELTLRLGDFGLSLTQLDIANSQSGRGVEYGEGDRVYMAPELLDNQYGWWNDIFSLGLSLLELIFFHSFLLDNSSCLGEFKLPHYGEEWIRLREDDFGGVPIESCPVGFEPYLELVTKSLCQSDPLCRPTASSLLSSLSSLQSSSLSLI